jgi:hypothetical protein
MCFLSKELPFTTNPFLMDEPITVLPELKTIDLIRLIVD